MARAVLPYCDHPAALKAVTALAAEMRPTPAQQKRIDAGKQIWEPADLHSLEWDLRNACSRVGVELHRTKYDKKTGAWLTLPGKLSDEQRKKLDILAVGEGCDVIEIAMNRPYWLELARTAAQEKAAGNKKQGAGSKLPAPGSKPLTAAEQKAAAAQEAAKKAERRKQRCPPAGDDRGRPHAASDRAADFGKIDQG